LPQTDADNGLKAQTAKQGVTGSNSDKRKNLIGVHFNRSNLRQVFILTNRRLQVVSDTIKVFIREADYPEEHL